MRCPNCKVAISYQPEKKLIHKDEKSKEMNFCDEGNFDSFEGYRLELAHCPNCNQLIIKLFKGVINLGFYGEKHLDFDENEISLFQLL